MADQLKFIRSALWPELFEYWREGEANDPDWIESYTSHGFASWEEWRKNYVEALQLDQRQWGISTVLNPPQTVPGFHGGPFRSWIKKHYQGVDQPTFAELATRASLQQQFRINRLINTFPAETMLIGLRQGNEITVIDGMHRACALALAAARHQSITTTLTIAVADATGEQLPIIGGFKKN